MGWNLYTSTGSKRSPANQDSYRVYLSAQANKAGGFVVVANFTAAALHRLGWKLGDRVGIMESTEEPGRFALAQHPNASTRICARSPKGRDLEKLIGTVEAARSTWTVDRVLVESVFEMGADGSPKPLAIEIGKVSDPAVIELTQKTANA